MTKQATPLQAYRTNLKVGDVSGTLRPAEQRSAPVKTDTDWLEEMLLWEAGRVRRPMMIGAVTGSVVGLVGGLNETNFGVLAVGISATFLSFFLTEAVITAAGRAAGWVFSARVDPEPEALIAAAGEWSSSV